MNLDNFTWLYNHLLEEFSRDFSTSRLLLLVGIAAGLLFSLGIQLIFGRRAQKKQNADFATLEKENVQLQQLKSQAEKSLAEQQERLIDEIRLRSGESAAQRERIAALETRLSDWQAAAAERNQLLENAKERLSDTFKALSHDALQNNAASFLKLGETAISRQSEQAKAQLEHHRLGISHIVQPLNELLLNIQKNSDAVEKERVAAYSSLHQILQTQANVLEGLRGETNNLQHALRNPAVRGSWGELQLRRVIELAGMLRYCDFIEQSISTGGEDASKLRPDVQVLLPNKRQIIIDAKAPIKAYLEAIAAPELEQKQQKLAEHVQQIKLHINRLSQKQYWRQFEQSPEFVVLFIPGDIFLHAALEQEPGLLEYAISKQIIISSPTTLIALLKAVAHGWQQEQLSENARMICALGIELHERAATFAEHFSDLKRGLEKANSAYDKALNSIDKRVLVTARKLAELGAASNKSLSDISPISTLAIQEETSFSQTREETRLTHQKISNP